MDRYVTSARRDTSDEVLEKHPNSGALFVVKGTGCTGAASVPLGGARKEAMGERLRALVMSTSSE